MIRAGVSRSARLLKEDWETNAPAKQTFLSFAGSAPQLPFPGTGWCCFSRMPAMAFSASQRFATASEVFPDWMPAVKPRNPATEETLGVSWRLIATP